MGLVPGNELRLDEFHEVEQRRPDDGEDEDCGKYPVGAERALRG